MNENITIQDNMQEDLQVDSINSGSDDNGIYTVDDDATFVMSGDLLPGGTDADADTLQPGDDTELSDTTTSDSSLSVSSGDVVGTEHVYISLADLETYQADTVENQIDYSASLGSIEEKIRHAEQFAADEDEEQEITDEHSGELEIAETPEETIAAPQEDAATPAEADNAAPAEEVNDSAAEQEQEAASADSESEGKED